MKKKFIGFLLIIILGFISRINVKASTPSGIYMGLSSSVEEVLPNEFVDITLSIHNVSNVLIEDDGIAVFMLYLYYDSTKFYLPEARTSVDEGVITNEVKLLGPQFTTDKLSHNDIICLYKLNNPNYLNIQIAYNASTDKTFNSDGDLFTLRFQAKDKDSGFSDFYIVNNTSYKSEVITYKENKSFPVDNSLAKQSVKIKSSNANINTIYVKDKETNQTYLAKYSLGYYDVALPLTTTNIEVIVNPTSSFASVGIEGNSLFENETSKFNIVVTAEDEVTIKRYLLNVRRMKDDNSLVEILLTNGQLLDGSNFVEIDNSVNEYHFDIKYTNSLILEPVLNQGSGAKVYYKNQETNSILLTELMTDEENNIQIVVRAENGAERIYNMFITMESPEEDLSLTNVETDPKVEPVIINDEYTFKYPYTSNNKVKLIIQPTAKNVDLSFTNSSIKFTKVDDKYISDFITILPGTTSFYEVSVTSTKGTVKNYTFILQMDKVSTESKLASIMVNDVIIDGFSSNIYKYSLGVIPWDVSSLKISANPINPLSEILGIGNEVTLSHGSDTIVITVKSPKTFYGEPQKETNYYLSYYRQDALNNTNTIEDILINGESISNFDFNIKEYDITLPYDVKIVLLDAVLSKESVNAKLSNNIGLNNLVVGKQQFIITCTSESGLFTDQFKINITRLSLNDDTSLKNIYIDNVELELDNNQYVLNVPYEKSIVNIEAIANNEMATVNGTGVKTLNVGENNIKILVYAEDKSISKEYIITIYRQSPSLNGLLKYLKIDGNNDLNFDPENMNYTILVPWETLSITIECETEDQKAVILPQFSSYLEFRYELSFGINKILINIKAEDGTITTYTLIVDRAVKYNNDSELKELKVEGFEAFELILNDEKVYSFHLIVPYTQTNINVQAIANSDKSLIYGAKDQILSVGPNQIDVICIAENKSTTTYSIIVIREPLSSDNNLKNIIIEELPGFTFEKDKEQYYISLKDTLSDLHITVEKSDENAVYNINGNQDLKTGMNQIEIKVTAPDSSIKVYTIFIDIQNSNPEQPWIYAFVTTSVVNVGLIGSIVFKIIKRRKITF